MMRLSITPLVGVDAIKLIGWLFFWIIGFAPWLQADNLVIDNNTRSINVTPYIEWQIVDDKLLPADNLDSKKFQQLATDIFPAIKTDQVIWIKFSVTNRSEKPHDMNLVVDNPYLDSIHLYVLRDKIYQPLYHVGDRLPFHMRPIDNPLFVLPVTLQTNSVNQYLLRMSSDGLKSFHLRLYDSAYFQSVDGRKKIMIFLVYGLYLGLIFIFLIGFIYTRKKYFMWFSLWSFFTILSDIHLQGYSYMLLWPIWPAFQQAAISTFTLMLCFFGIKAIENFLDRDNLFTVWAKVFKLYYVIAFLVAVSLLLADTTVLKATIAQVFYLLTTVFAIAYLGYRITKGDRLAGLLFLAIIAMFIVFSLRVTAGFFTHIDFYDFSLTLQPISLLIQILVFGFSVGYMFRKVLLQEQKAAKDVEISMAKINARRDFLSQMSHEIRTPIAGVIGMSDLLAQSNLNPEQSRFNSAIQNAGGTLLQVINDILDFSKIEAGKLTIEKSIVNLQELTQEVYELLQFKFQQSGLEYHRTIDPSLPIFIEGDAFRIKQILINYLSNALKFTKIGSISLKIVKQSPSTLTFFVTDTGIGMSREKSAKLFTEFEQGDAGVSSKFGGTGLGLAICKKLAEAMHGSVDVKSAPDKGSEFVFVMPLVIPSEAQLDTYRLRDASPAVVSSSAYSLRILMAEDNPTNIMIAESLLKKLGHSLVVTSNGKELIAKFSAQQQDFDLILMDCEMPEMDGFEATQIIRGQLNSAIPIVALTAHAMEEERHRCLSIGMNQVLTKPIKIEQLINTLNAVNAALSN